MARRMLCAGPARTTALYPLSNGHVLGLRARARRANMLVREREASERPQPRQEVWWMSHAGHPSFSVMVHEAPGDEAHVQVQTGQDRFWGLREFLQVVLVEDD